MKTCLLIALVLLTATTNATNYYFSTLSGSDLRTAAEAKNPATPWKSLNKLSSFFSSLKPGDSVLLKRNETFYGSINIKISGMATAPIVIGAYGTGNKPVVTSLVTLTDWVFKGNGIWESYNALLGTSLNNVLLNDMAQQKGRYPNNDAPNKGYLTFESHAGKTSITDNEFSSSTNWAGAELVMRTRRWILDRNKIVSNTANSITYTASSPYEPYDNYGYFIQNSLKALDKFGEWYYNPATKKLSVYFGSGNPSAYAVKATTIENLISSYNMNYVVIDNLTIKGANEAGMDIEKGSDIKVKNCDIIFSGVNGVIIRDHTSFTIENCVISHSNNIGIDFAYGSDYAVVRNNKILNTSLVAGMGLSNEGNGLAVYSSGNGSIVESNLIRNTGYIGITYAGSNVIVKNNVVDSFCVIKDDGSGIYAHGADVYYTGRKVVGNIVMNGIGAGLGTENALYFPASGIYMDNNATETEISGNTLMNCSNYGIYIHNSTGMTISNNTLYNNGKQLSMIQDADNAAIRNNIITNNVLFSKYPSQFVAYFRSSGDDIGLFGRFDSNYYARPLDDKITFFNQYVTAEGTWVNQSLDLEGWKEKYGMDAYSKISAKQIAPYVVTNIIGANKVANGTFTTNITGVAGTSCTISHSASGMMQGGYLQVVPSVNKSSVYVKIGELTAGKTYILRYTVRGSVEGNMTIGGYLRQGASPYGTLTSTQYRAVSTIGKAHELLFSAGSSEVSATIVFKVDELSKYYLDNIEVYEAETGITNPDDSMRMEYNAGNVAKSFNINGSYMDVKGKKYFNTLVLQPYTAAILMKIAAFQNEAPAVSLSSPSAYANFAAPAQITLSANATDEDGLITSVSFYNRNVLLGSDSTSPYTFTWNNNVPGDYVLTAKAIDNGGLATTSDSVAVSIFNANEAPTVSLTNPLTGEGFNGPAEIVMAASANYAEGSLAKVEFYNAQTLLGADTTSPYTFTWSNVAPGYYILTAKATGINGLVTFSDSVIVSVIKPNEAPAVTITSPLAEAGFTAPAEIIIAASANDIDGAVAKVEFYNENTFLGADSTSPYTFTLSGVIAGNYALTAKATDNGGLITSSAVVNVSVVVPKVAPTLAVTSPVAGESFTAPAAIDITATADDIDGIVAKIEFYKGDSLLGADYTRPFTFKWSNVLPGNYAVKVKATDNDGLTTSNTVNVVMLKANVPPAVSIISPVDGTKPEAPAFINITALATDTDGSVVKVEFYDGNNLLGTQYTSPYTFTWSNVDTGRYYLTAKAYDNAGLFTSSAVIYVSVLVANIAPTVMLTSPVAGENFIAPAAINISATAEDVDGTVAKIEFFNGNTLLGTDYTRPYTFKWSNVLPGNYTLTVKATDNDDLATLSNTVTVVMLKANVPPAVSITSPLDGTKPEAPAVINIIASATDTDGSIDKVEFYDKDILLGTKYTSPYTFTWSNVDTGRYYLTAKAYDNGGSVTSSAVVYVSVLAANIAPTVTLTSPFAGESFTAPAAIDISVTADDVDGTVAKIDFFKGDSLLGTDYTRPYTFKWSNVAPGNYALKVKATDNDDAVTLSNMVNITMLKANLPPVISITSPLDGAKPEAPAVINITVAATDEDGSIDKVEFYDRNTLLGTQHTSPYTFTWSNVDTGRYYLTAKAYDNVGSVTSSAVVYVSVLAANIAPTVTLNSPVAGESFTAPAAIDISVTADDVDGTVAKIEFFKGDSLLGTDYTRPYTFKWSNVAPGNYALKVKATDNDDATASATVNVVMLKANVKPAVSITTPLASTKFDAPAVISITAAATDADGFVTRVEFYNGITLLGTQYISPYTFTWSNVDTGKYYLTAKAFDNGGAATTSAAVYVSVLTPNAAPTIAITSPVAGESFTAPAAIDISVTADDVDGTVAKIEFFKGDSLLGTDYTRPYTFKWSNVAPGNYTLKVKATDNDDATASATVNVVMLKANVKPAASITTPLASTKFDAPAVINITTVATDADGSVTRVEFYNGNILLGTQHTSPYIFTWSNVDTGKYYLTAKAFDNGGAATTSAAVYVSVVTPNVAPTITITSPVAGESFTAPAAIVISVTADDVDGMVTKIEFYKADSLLGTDYTKPYTFNWSNVVPGNYALTAKAVDNKGLATSKTVNVVMLKANIKPAVSITNPVASTKFEAPAVISITAAATDADGSVTRVEFYNGNILLGIQYTSPYTFIWSNVDTGKYYLTAKAFDNGGSATTSAAIYVSVVVANIAPTLTVTSPFTGENFIAPAAINISATADDIDGTVAKIEFYNGNILLGTDYTRPYTFKWSNIAAGNYLLIVKAIDNRGLTVSKTVNIIMQSANAPSLAKAGPADSLSSAISSSAKSNELASIKDGYKNIYKHNTESIAIKIGPNPATNVLSVFTKGLQRNQELKISVLSMSGRQLKTIVSNTSNEVTQVNVSSLIAGIYLVKISSKEETIYKPFKKQ